MGFSAAVFSEPANLRPWPLGPKPLIIGLEPHLTHQLQQDDDRLGHPAVIGWRRQSFGVRPSYSINLPMGL